MTPSHAKGTKAESDVVTYLKEFWPYAERRALQGTKDRGDIAGVPGVVWEVKSGSRLEIPRWLSETRDEVANDNATVGVLVVKPRGIGSTRVGEWWAISQLDSYSRLLQLAGF